MLSKGLGIKTVNRGGVREEGWVREGGEGPLLKSDLEEEPLVKPWLAERRVRGRLRMC